MLRRLLSTLIESTTQTTQSESIMTYPYPFTKRETIDFGWLTNVAPCFPVKATNIKILTEPQQFYNTLIEHCQNATNRITLASLYFGNGNLEKQMVAVLMNNSHFQNGKLKINILLDYTRGSRFDSNSRTILQPLLLQRNGNNNCQISLYHTPVLRGFLKKIAPNRWNELFGLQHMKLYIFDDTLIISGANLSNDYFTNRQDRYFVIKDQRLCDFYCGLVNKVQNFSLLMDKNNQIGLNPGWNYWPYSGPKTEFIEKAGDLIENYLQETKVEKNLHMESGYDTWVFPLVQMGQLGIDHDAQITDKLLAESPDNSTLRIATGYFNLTNQYMNTLIKRSKAYCHVLMAHPKANGFLGAKGAAGGIPAAYSLIADEFRNEFVKYGQENRIKLSEYLKDKWTYHAKGLWYYPPNSSYPCLTLIGSPNFGERSVGKDLETQLAIVTENVELQKKLHGECVGLYDFGLPAETKRTVPSWVYAFVFFFRNYF